MNRLSLLVAVTIAVATAALADEPQPRPASARPDDVILTSDPDAIEFCAAVGEVKAKSGLGYQGGAESVNSTIRQRAAALGATVVQMQPPSTNALMITSGHGTAYRCSADALEKQRAKAAERRRREEEMERRASEPVICDAGADCEMKWSRVIPWLQDHSTWKFRNVTDTLITTEGPMETPNPAFEVTKVPSGDGKTYRISIRTFCGSALCDKQRLVDLRLNFRESLLKPVATAQ